MRTSEVIKRFGLDPELEWKRGWKVVRKKGRNFASCKSKAFVEYKDGQVAARVPGNGPLTGFRYKRHTVRFMRNNPTSFNIELKPMLYIECEGDTTISVDDHRYAVWYRGGNTARHGILGVLLNYMPLGTIYAEKIVIY